VGFEIIELGFKGLSKVWRPFNIFLPLLIATFSLILCNPTSFKLQLIFFIKANSFRNHTQVKPKRTAIILTSSVPAAYTHFDAQSGDIKFYSPV